MGNDYSKSLSKDIKNYTPLLLDAFDVEQLRNISKINPTLSKKLEFLKHLQGKECAGFITKAAELTGIHRSTTNIWRENDPEFAKMMAEAIREGEDRVKDEAWLGLRKGAIAGKSAIVLRINELTHPEVVGPPRYNQTNIQVNTQVNQATYYDFAPEKRAEFNKTFDEYFEEKYGHPRNTT